MQKKSQKKVYTSSTHGEIRTSVIKTTGTIIASLIAGAVVGIFSFIRLADTNSFMVRANAADITEIKEDLVPRPEWESTTKTLLQSDIRIESKLDTLLLK